ncbi:DUF6438 domain-containing protein [Epilithonimonas sp.]|uniref:DUF6438 domain-containing protein n=1 Tax=Epilithonimonas sp. TaxID=2894511 RepID=UPI0028A10B69|nr:DUF6438 domain-containing protein [Epilithonimonas sp.]
MKYLFSLLIFLGLMSCTTSQTSQYSKIEYEAGPCFGFCPIYKIIINPDRTAILEAEHYNFTEGERGQLETPREGTFKSTINKEDFDKLISITDAANVKTLKDSYEDKRIMDASKNNLRIYFSDGSKKEIKLSAGEKPAVLTTLQNYISKLKEKQKWEKVN